MRRNGVDNLNIVEIPQSTQKLQHQQTNDLSCPKVELSNNVSIINYQFHLSQESAVHMLPSDRISRCMIHVRLMTDGSRLCTFLLTNKCPKFGTPVSAHVAVSAIVE